MINIICWLASFSARHRHCLLSKRQIYLLKPLPFAVSKENHRLGFDPDALEHVYMGPEVNSNRLEM